MKELMKCGQAKILMLLLAGSLSLLTSAQGFLKASGPFIVNEKGEKVILRGMGLGGWMLQEGYMFRVANLGQQYRIREKIEEVVGPEKTKRFCEQWLQNHTTKKDIDSLASWGFNSIRLPMHYRLYTRSVEEEPVRGENTWIQKGFDLTDSLLKWCGQNKMYLILDLHAAPGGQGNDLPISDRNPSQPSLWQSEANRQKMIALWSKLAQRYANEKWIGGYDIINEPNWGFEDEKDTRGISEKKNEPLKKLMVDITTAIREVDKKHLIIVEGNGFGNNYRGLVPTWDDNMVLSFHKYGNFNTVGAIQGFLDLREKYNVPIWLGESGENSNTWFTEAIQLAESHGIGWAWWQEKKMGINNPVGIKQPEGYDKLLNYWSGKGAKPSETEAWTILQQLLQNIKLENNIFHPDVVDALFRQVKTTATLPFKNLVLDKRITIQAVDFDLGRQRFAYYDKDSASYQYTAGVNTKGNRGYSYRNDGVDIQNDNDRFFVFNIEDGEWLQYTIDVKKAGTFYISFTTASDKETGIISLLDNEKTVIEKLSIEPSGSSSLWKVTTSAKVKMDKGIHKIRVRFDKGGFNFYSLQFEKDPPIR
jgi:endoglucanase